MLCISKYTNKIINIYKSPTSEHYYIFETSVRNYEKLMIQN